MREAFRERGLGHVHGNRVAVVALMMVRHFRTRSHVGPVGGLVQHDNSLTIGKMANDGCLVVAHIGRACDSWGDVFDSKGLEHLSRELDLGVTGVHAAWNLYEQSLWLFIRLLVL